MFDQTLFLLFPDKIPEMVLIIFGVICPHQPMEQIEIKITGSGAFKAGVKLLFSTFLAAALHPGNHFGGDFVCVPGITIRYSGFERCFGTAVAIAVSK